MKEAKKQHQASISAIIILALFFNAISPLFISFANASTLATKDSPFGDKILICTAEGFKYVNIEDFANGDYPQENDSRPHCPLCIINTVKTDKFIPTITTIKALKVTTTKIHYHILGQVTSYRAAVNNINPRAPPNSFSS